MALPVTTTNEFPDRKTLKVLGIVQGVAVYSGTITENMGGGFQRIAGGENRNLESVYEKAITQGERI